MKKPIEVVCPCCDTKLTVDPTKGDVLAEDRPRQMKSFEDAMSKVRSGSARREKAFSKAFDRTQRQDDVLNKKFEEAKKKAAKDGDARPVNPLDLD